MALVSALAKHFICRKTFKTGTQSNNKSFDKTRKVIIFTEQHSSFDGIHFIEYAYAI